MLALLLCGAAAWAQSAYRYKDANGNWVYTDKAPAAATAHDDAIALGHQSESLHMDIERSDQGTATSLTGSTGFSSGPHLHFCVIRNGGTEAVSVPVEFAGPADVPVTPETGKPLTAY